MEIRFKIAKIIFTFQVNFLFKVVNKEAGTSIDEKI